MRLCLVNLMIRETTACQLLGVLCNQCNWLWSASCRPIYVPFQEEMGNASSGGASAPQSPTIRICLRTSKRSNGCPCFLSEHTSTWEAITQNEKFRPYVLRHLLDEGLICSVLESGERQHSLVACEGVLYYEVRATKLARGVCTVHCVSLFPIECNWNRRCERLLLKLLHSSSGG